MSSVGKNIPHDSAKGHVTGQSIYIDDIPPVANEVLVDFYGSPVAHGKIKRLNLDKAKKVPGVVALFTYKDLDGENKFGSIIKDEVLLVEDLAEFIGHPIVVIAATDRHAIKLAKEAIEIEIEELEPIFSISKAIEKQKFIGTTRTIKRGDVDKAFKEAAHTIEGTFINGGQDHFYLESQACLAYPGEHDTLVLHSSTQNPSEVQEVAAHVLGLQFNQVVCETKRMGGGFGGKECQATHPAVMAGLVALKTKRPARIVMSKDDDMKYTGKRHGFQNDYKVAFNKDGLITGLKVHFYSDGGAFSDLSPAVLGRAMTHAENAYYIENAEIIGQICKTNLPPNTAFRGFGGPQGIVNMESIIEEIAAFLKKDPYDVRVLNCYGINERNVTPYGEILENNTLPKLFSELEQSSNYKQRLEEVKRFNAKSKTQLKGISMAPVKFGISFNTKFLNQANALVNIYLDGTIQVSTGATEMGQGVNTKIQQLVAGEFSLEPSAVRVMITSTEKNNNTSATAASSASDLNGSAAVNACIAIKERMSECAARYLAQKTGDMQASPSHIVFENGKIYDKRRPQFTIPFKELVTQAYRERISLGERGFYATKGVDYNPETGSGHPFLYYTMGTAVAEVTIDRFTGHLTIDQLDVLMDIGKSINPGIDRGQITGAFVQGMGWVTNEELRYDAKGELLSHSPTTYKIPNIQDIPEIFNVNWIDNDTNTVNIKGSKAVGEPPLCLGISIWTAVKHALSFVSGAEIPKLNLPATGEEILSRLTYYAGKTGAEKGKVAGVV